MSTKYILFRIELKRSSPKIWRRFFAPADIKLSDFHNVLIRVMGWNGYHLYEFKIRDEIFFNAATDYKELFGLDEDEVEDLFDEDEDDDDDELLFDEDDEEDEEDEEEDIFGAIAALLGGRQISPTKRKRSRERDTNARLDSLGLRKGSVIHYVYDMGDYWEHAVKVIDPDYSPPPEFQGAAGCLAGEGGCPPEDCGGIDAYYEDLEWFREIISKDESKLTEEESHLMMFSLDSWDPDNIDFPQINHALAMSFPSRSRSEPVKPPKSEPGKSAKSGPGKSPKSGAGKSPKSGSGKPPKKSK
ncbi:MAG: plasmid pRiA4b ORF-3 family protein [Deltaproteobacteria bacterium]|jgi:hypothetical protein|nr:plasmid pRiA4b ORF-3 family protein [Deltaproteobacteria bacterium]